MENRRTRREETSSLYGESGRGGERWVLEDKLRGIEVVF